MRDQFVEATSKCQTGDSRLDEIDCQHMSRVYNANLLAKCSLNLIVQLNSMVMKLLLDVKDEKAEVVMEMLQRLPYVKVKELEAIHFRILDDAIQIVDDVHLIEQGKLKTRDAKEFLNELLCQNDAKV
jgi:hypothetical protein